MNAQCDTIVTSNTLCPGTSATFDITMSCQTMGNDDYTWTINQIGGGPNPVITSGGTGSGSSAITATIGDLGMVSGDFGIEILVEPNGETAYSVFDTFTILAGVGYSLGTMPASCEGVDNGQINITAITGSGPFDIDWTGGVGATGIPGPNYDITGLADGNYDVTVTSMDGCSFTAPTIAVMNAPGVTYTVGTMDASCSGVEDGEINLTMIMGMQPLTVAWDGSESGSESGIMMNSYDIPTLQGGTYGVTVTDANTCTLEMTSISVAEGAGVSYSIGTMDSSCDGIEDGEINITSIAGTMPYTVNWSGAETGSMSGIMTNTFDIIDLQGGTYTVVVSDMNGCFLETSSVMVTDGAGVTFSAAGNDASCEGVANGSISLTSIVSSGSYVVSWTGTAAGNSGGQSGTSYDIMSLEDGTYDVNILDANGCSEDVLGVTVGNGSGVSFTALPNVTSCEGSATGSITITILTGSPDFTYSYTGASGSSGNSGGTTFGGPSFDIPSLEDDTYTVTITDDNGCSSTLGGIVVANGVGVTFTASENQATCENVADGSIDITILTGTANYTWSYTGSNGSSGGPMVETSMTFDIPNLEDAFYDITIEDNNSCSNTLMNVEVTNLYNFMYSTTVNDPDCNGGTDGEIIITPNGTAPYDWDISPGGMDTNVPLDGGSFAISGLSMGSYDLTVTDANGCTSTSSAIMVNDPAALTFMGVGEGPTCNSGTDGEISVTIGNGLAPYSWNVTGPNSSSGSNEVTNPFTINNLISGSYAVTVTDANMCVVSSTVDVEVPNTPAVTMTATISDPLCNGGEGSIEIVVANGTGPYVWSYTSTAGNDNGVDGNADGDDTFVISNLDPGTYTINVADGNTCIAVPLNGLVINDPAPLTLAETANDPTCFEGDDGSIELVIGNGLAPYNWTYNDGTGTTSSSTPDPLNPVIITGLASGTYDVTITDDNGCTAVETNVVLNDPAQLSTSITSDNGACSGESNGGYTIETVTNGTGPFSYSDNMGNSGGPSSLPIDVTGVAANTYIVTVTDANGCTASNVVVVDTDLDPMGEISGSSSFCSGGSTTLTAVDDTGVTPSNWTFVWSTTETSASIVVSSAATYMVTITDTDTDCTNVFELEVTESPNLAVSITGDLTLCGTEMTTLMASDNSGWTHVWSTNETSSSITVSTAGIYSVTVTDTNTDCDGNSSVEVIQNDRPTAMLDLVTVDSYCYNEDAPNIEVTLTGTGPFDFIYTRDGANPVNVSNAISPFIIDVIEPGTYQVIEIVDNFCPTEPTYMSNSIAITQFTEPTITLTPSAQPAYCPGGSVTVGMDEAHVGYTWRNPAGQVIGMASTIDISLAGLNYSVDIVDVNGCMKSQVFNIEEQAEVDVNISGPTSLCTGSTIQLNAGNWEEWIWSEPGETTQFLDVTEMGTYSVTVTDENDCTGSSAVSVSEFALPTTTVPEDIDFCAGTMADDLIFELDGTGPFSAKFTINNGSEMTGTVVGSQLIITNPAPGDYRVVEIVDLSSNCPTEMDFETDPVSVNAIEIPDFNITTSESNSTILCAGSMMDLGVNISNPELYVFSWTGPGGPYPDGETIEISMGGDYMVTATQIAAPNCFNTATITITISEVNSSITSNKPDNETCFGDPITLIAGAGTSNATEILWDSPIPSNVNTNFEVEVSPSSEQLYTATLTNGNGCSDEFSITIGVNALPEPEIISGNEFCEEEVFIVTTDIEYESYIWSGSESMDYPYANQAVLGETSFSVTVTDENGCVGTDNQMITVNPRPVIQISPIALTTEEFEPVVFTATDLEPSVNCPIDSFQWFYNGVYAESTTTNTYETSFDNQDVTNVSVVAYNSCGCVSESSEMNIEINPSGSCSVDLTIPPNFCVGVTEVLSADPMEGAFQETKNPQDGYFEIDGLIIRPPFVVKEGFYSPMGRSFQVIDFETIEEPGIIYDRIEIKFFDNEEYNYRYYVEYGECGIFTSLRTIEVNALPAFEDMIIDSTACFGEDPKIDFILPDNLPNSFDWTLNYETSTNTDIDKSFTFNSSKSITFPNVEDDLEVNFLTLTDNKTLCSNILFEPVSKFTIEVSPELEIETRDSCDFENEFVKYFIELEGGTGDYTVNGENVINGVFESDFILQGVPATFNVVDEGCSEENLEEIKFDTECKKCIFIQDSIIELGIDVTEDLYLCENELGVFELSALPVVGNQIAVYAIQNSTSQFYDETNIILDSIPSNPLRFEFEYDEELFVLGEKYYIVMYIFSAQAGGFKVDETCSGTASKELIFFGTPNAVIDASLEEDMSICKNEIDYQLTNSLGADINSWSSDDPTNVMFQDDATNNRVLVSFTGDVSGTVKVYLNQENSYSVAGTTIGCSDSDSITLNVIDRIAPREDSIIWFPGNFLAYTDTSKCYEWGFIDSDLTETNLTTETTRFYIYDQPGEFTDKTFFVDVWSCDDTAKECVTRVFYNASQPPVLGYKPDADYELELFPNPNLGQFIIRLDGEQGGVFQFRMYSSTGILLTESEFVKEYTEHEEIFDMQNLASGLYIVQVIDKGGRTSTIKMIKN